MKQWQPSSLFNATSRPPPPRLYSPVGDKDRNRKEDPKPTLKSDHKLWLCELKGAHLAGDCYGIETNPHFVKYQLFKWVLWNLLAYAVYVSFWFSKKGLTSLIFHAESKSLWRHIAAWWESKEVAPIETGMDLRPNHDGTAPLFHQKDSCRENLCLSWQNKSIQWFLCVVSWILSILSKAKDVFSQGWPNYFRGKSKFTALYVRNSTKPLDDLFLEKSTKLAEHKIISFNFLIVYNKRIIKEQVMPLILCYSHYLLKNVLQIWTFFSPFFESLIETVQIDWILCYCVRQRKTNFGNTLD